MDSRARHLRTENRSLREEIRALTEEIAYLKRALENSSLDDLTGLLRRKIFEDLVDQEILLLRRHPGRSLSILIVDINDLKKVNDIYGHPAGDKVIVAFAQSLRDSLRDCDIVARAGGDEFLVFLPEQDEEGAGAALVRLMRTFEGLKQTLMPAFYGASIGSATTTVEGSDGTLKTFAELYKEADVGMYRHKKILKHD